MLSIHAMGNIPFATAGTPPRFLIVEGEIGSGKTTLLDHAEHELGGYRVILVHEPVDEWVRTGILKLFYEDPKAFAYEFQTAAFATRVTAIRAALVSDAARIVAPAAIRAADPRPTLFILERSPETDRLFMELQFESGAVDPRLRAVYESWAGVWTDMLHGAHPDLPDPAVVAAAPRVYLKTPLSVCQARVAGRARRAASGEGYVSFEYQAQLRRAHEAVLQGLHPDAYPHLARCASRVLVVEDAMDGETDYPAICRRIGEFLG
jgi:deoxyadenosine/deoxycytidine kinase